MSTAQCDAEEAEALEPRHLVRPSKLRTVTLAMGALLLASPAYLYSALNRPAAVVRLKDASWVRHDHIVVKVGQAVVWRNESSAPQVVSVDDGSSHRSARLLPGDTFEHRFRAHGRYRFGDEEGPLVGVVSVEP